MTKKIKKINIFLPSLEKGGVLNIFKNITRYLLNKNIKVHLYTNSYNKIKSILAALQVIRSNLVSPTQISSFFFFFNLSKIFKIKSG